MMILTDPSEIEDRLRRLNSDPRSTFDLPSEVKFTGLGTEAAYLQYLLTWAHRNPQGVIKTELRPGFEQASIRNIAQSTHAFVAFLLGRAISRQDGGLISGEVRGVIRAEYSSAIPLVFNYDTKTSRFFVHSNSPLIPPTYEPYIQLAVDGLRAERKLTFLRAFGAALVDFHSATKTAPLYEDTSILREVAYELFSNAEEWGSTDESGKRVRLPIRGILLKAHNAYSNPRTQTDPLQKYFKMVSDTGGGAIMEVAVIDAGLGFSERYDPNVTARNISKELDDLYSCLRKHRSSSRLSTRGNGLHYVMDLVSSMKGFLRIRSGRLNLYRDFSSEPYPSAGSRAKQHSSGSLTQHMRDWQSNRAVYAPSDSNAKEEIPCTECAPVRGVLIDFFLPLRSNQAALL